jgi:hypothetical protein
MKKEIIYSSEKKSIKIQFGENALEYHGEVVIEIARHLTENENATLESIKNVAAKFI